MGGRFGTACGADVGGMEAAAVEGVDNVSLIATFLSLTSLSWNTYQIHHIHDKLPP